MSAKRRPALPANCYTQRISVKDGPCFVCGLLTANVLIADSGEVSDWFYVCSAHIQLPKFCSVIDDTTLSESLARPADIQPHGEEKDLAPTDKAADGEKSPRPESPTAASKEETDKTPLSLMKPRYALSTHYFYMRQRPFLKRWEQLQAEELVRQLPSVPQHRPQ
ncbi:hypothetical protein H4R23_004084 [Coemansia sp. Cherry 401B]|nr:hypothetical protein H4R23_004084 [Coemansia sp. Cherry 401B]